jgi:endonuclease YncB( thermonuclease family)
VIRRLSAAVFLATAGCSGASSTGSGDPDPAGAPAPAASPAIEVVRVLDGDSLEARVGGEQTEIRLLGINANERGECWSDEARSALIGLLDAGPVSLDAAGGTDRYGRTLGYLDAGGIAVNRAMVEAGHALALSLDHPERAAFLAAEEDAVSAGRGWWSPGACGPDGGHTVQLASVEHDPPGPDDENLNGESVTLRGDGIAVPIGGWTLRDESSSHRYSIPNGTILEAGRDLVVRTGCGRDGPLEVFWCAPSPVWSNGGDAVLLLDASGNPVARLRYP